MKFFRKFWLRNDQARARDALQDICDDRIAARRKMEQLDRDAERALVDAKNLETERFRLSFFGRRNPVRSGFIGGSAQLFGITSPTRFVVVVPVHLSHRLTLIESTEVA